MERVSAFYLVVFAFLALSLMTTTINAADPVLQKMLTTMADGIGLDCKTKGQYCNTFFNIKCCTRFACIPKGVAGGACVA